MLDESTSAIDTTTESIIYQLLIDLNVWFVTISHRPSLIRYHNKELKLFLPSSAHRDHHHHYQQDPSLNDDPDVTIDLSTDPETTSTRTTDDEEIRARPSITPGATAASVTTPAYVEVKKSKWFVDIRDVWKLIHLPFPATDRRLRVQVRFRWHRLHSISIALVLLDLRNLVRLPLSPRLLLLHLLSCHRPNWCYLQCPS